MLTMIILSYRKMLERSTYAIFSTKFALNVAIFTYTMRCTFTFLHSTRKKKPILIGHFRNITFMVYIIIKTYRKRLLQTLNPFEFSFMSLYIFNLDYELGSYLFFSTQCQHYVQKREGQAEQRSSFQLSSG